MYKRETPKQFERRMRQMNAEKRLTKNQRLWEEEARKLRNRLAAAEKKGFRFISDIVPPRPERVRQKDISYLSKIKGINIYSYSDYINVEGLKSGKIKIADNATDATIYIGIINGEIVASDLPDVMPSATAINVTDIHAWIDTPFDDPRDYIHWKNEGSENDEDDANWPDDLPDDETPPDTSDEGTNPEDDYYKNNPEREHDDGINVDIGEAVIENAYSLIATQAGEIDNWDVSNSIKETKRDAGARLKSLLDGAISVFGRRAVAYNLQNYGAETFTQYVERALFYVAAYSDSATDMVTNAALNDIRDVLFRDDPGMAASYDFEDYDNV